MFSVLNILNLHKVLKSVDLFEFVCNWRNPPMHLRSIRPIVLKFQKCWIFNGLDQRYAIVHSRVSFFKIIFFFSFPKSLCYVGHKVHIYIHMLFSYSLQKKSLIPFVKNLVPFLCNRVDSKGITFESSASRGEFTLANQISSHSNSYYINIWNPSIKVQFCQFDA